MRLCLWQLSEHTTRPPIGIHNSLLNENIPTESGQQHRPHNIVDSSRSEEAQSHHAMQVVWKLLVDILVRCWRDVRRNGKVEIGQHEEHSHWNSGADPRRPVWEVLVFGEVDID